MKGKIWIYILRGVLIFCAMIGVGIFMVCRTTTMINPWIVATVCAVLSVPISWLFSQRFRGIINFRNLPLRVATWVILTAPILAGTFYCINSAGAAADKATIVPAVVERKYYTTHQRTRRVRKVRYIPTGETYRTYYADIRLDNGHLVTVSITTGKVHKVRVGQHLDMKVSRGTFGIPVVLTRGLFQ